MKRIIYYTRELPEYIFDEETGKEVKTGRMIETDFVADSYNDKDFNEQLMTIKDYGATWRVEEDIAGELQELEEQLWEILRREMIDAVIGGGRAQVEAADMMAAAFDGVDGQAAISEKDAIVNRIRHLRGLSGVM